MVTDLKGSRLRSICRSVYLQGRRSLRAAKSYFFGAPLSLRPIGQLDPVDGEKGLWQATGNDPKFACIADGFNLKAGWYGFSIDLEDASEDRLEPVLYFDHGYGMHETWSVHLNFVRFGEKHHRGVVLLPLDVVQLRFDPASVPCTFRAENLRLKRLSRIGASWRMLRAVVKNKKPAGETALRLLGDALHKMKSPSGRHAFAVWLHGLYVDDGAKSPTYDRWLRLYDQHDAPASAPSERLFSIILPVFNTPEVWLRRCLDSVLGQSYKSWELCIADDASTAPQVRAVLDEYAAREPSRIRICWRTKNGHISAASNSALALATGDYVLLLDHDDELHLSALSTIADALQRNPKWKFVYSDEDKIDALGRRYEPYFKPDWNLDLLHGQNCVSHLGIYSRELMTELGGFREGLEGSQDWDLALRFSERLGADEIGHVPVVLYHWRAIAGSTAQGVGEKSYAHDAGRRALTQHFERLGEDVEVREISGVLGAFRIRFPLTAPLPLISIIIPTRDRLDLLRRCVDSVIEHSTYPNYEILIVDNQSVELETLAYFDGFDANTRVRVWRYDQPFNYSRINNEAVLQCAGELVCLLNNDVEVITPDWMEEMASHAMRPRVGAVGAMLYYPNGSIQHAGVITGVHGVAAHPYCGMPRGFSGQMARAKLTQAMSAVTAACLMIRREVYLQAGGLDASLQVAFNDIDFCLRVGQLGYVNIWTPFAELYHHESASRGHEDTVEKRARFMGEVEFMVNRWAGQLERDPAYNPNLTLSGAPFSLAFPPRDWRRTRAEDVSARNVSVSESFRVVCQASL